MKRNLLSLALLASVMTANAQHNLVKDINPTGNSMPSRLTVMGNKLIFAANDGLNGYELWMMDSAQNASLAYNINPGSDWSMFNGIHMPMAVLGGYVYFHADNGTTGTELYRWNGTGAPTLAAEVMAGPMGSNAHDAITMNGKIYFSADDGINGDELWVYDPTTNSAMRLSNISTTTGSNVTNLIAFDGKVFFSGFEPIAGTELYCYNPATNNTTLAMDIENGVGSSFPDQFHVIDSTLYFAATTAANGREMYTVTKTTNTVARITDVATGGDDGIFFGASGSSIAKLGGSIYFSGNEGTISYGQLFKFDPATGTTSLVYKVNPTGNSFISNLTNYAGKLYFTAYEPGNNTELWRYNGSGTATLVADINPNVNGSFPMGLTVFNGKLYFAAEDSAHGNELFVYNDSTLSVQSIQFAADVNVYPNPATSAATLQMNLQHSETLQVKMTDMQGRIVYNTNAVKYAAGENKVNLPMASLATGTYLYVISNESGNTLHAGRVQKQ